MELQGRQLKGVKYTEGREEFLMELVSNKRQIKVVSYAKKNERITSKEHKEINNISKLTSTRYLRV